MIAMPSLVSAATNLGLIDTQHNINNKSMGWGWQTNRYQFHASKAGTYTISLNATRPYVRMKAGTSQWNQEFFRDANGDVSSREQNFEVAANENVYLTVWKDNNSNASKHSLSYDLDIVFKPTASEQGQVTKIYAHLENALSSHYNANGHMHNWGQGKNLVIDGFEFGGIKYAYTTMANRVEIVRSNNSNASGAPCGLFAQKSGTSQYDLAPTYPEGCDMAKVMKGRVINVGALDLFRNSGSTAKNIERVDFITDAGITAPTLAENLAKAGHVVTEKSGNNPIKIAAILSLDSDGVPSAFGPLVDVDKIGRSASHSYGMTKIHLPDGTIIDKQGLEFLVNAQNGTQGEPWQISETSEALGMSFVSLQALGIAAGQKYYGFSYFGEDVTSSYDLTKPDTFPVDNFNDTADPYGGVAGYFMDEEIANPTTSEKVCPDFAKKDIVWYVDNGKNIRKVDMKTGTDTYEYTNDQVMGDIAISPDGSVYAVDLTTDGAITKHYGSNSTDTVGRLGVSKAPNALSFDENAYLYVGYYNGKYYQVKDINNVSAKSEWFNPSDFFIGQTAGSAGDVLFANGKAYASILNTSTHIAYLVEIELGEDNSVSSKKIVGQIPGTSYGLSSDGFGGVYVGVDKTIWKLDLSHDAEYSKNYVIPKTKTATTKYIIYGLSGENESLGNACVRPVISILDASADEGDAGIQTIAFTIESDIVIPSDDSDFAAGLMLNYTLSDDTAIVGADYQAATGIVTIPVGSSSALLSLPVVIGDRSIEGDESFTLKISASNATFTDDTAKGTILDDDYNRFTAYDQDESLANTPVIKTKKVGEIFTLRLVKIKDASHYADIYNDTNNTKVRLVDASVCEQAVGDLNTSGFIDFTMPTSSAVVTHTFTNSELSYMGIANKAMKQVKAQFVWEDDKGIKRTSCSADSFSIRPNAYKIALPADGLVAGKDFNLTIKAVGIDGAVVSNYEEHAAVYALDVNETKTSTNPTCTIGSINAPKTSFIDGIATIAANYSDIGTLKFTVREEENSDSEYANIDKNDGSGDQRFIDEDTVTSGEVSPAKISLRSILSSNGAHGYTYYAGKNSDNGISETDEMAARLYTHVSVENESGNPVENFKSGCYAKDVNINVTYEAMGQADLIPDVIYTEQQEGADPTMNTPTVGENSFGFHIDQALFESGEGNQSVKINFGREKNKALNPFKLRVTDVNASVAGYQISDNKVPTGIEAVPNETTFIYIRAHVPSPQVNVGKEKNVTVSYEVYAKDANLSAFGLAGLPESEDDVHWYVMPVGLTAGLDYENLAPMHGSAIVNHSSPSQVLNQITLTHANESTINIVVGKAPHKNKIFYSPKTEYLKFDTVNENVDRHSFSIDFSPTGAKWSGKGDLGMTADTNVAKRSGLQKMDW